MKSKIRLSIFLVVYLALTFVKLFIGVVYVRDGTEVFLLAKTYPTIGNVWLLGGNYEDWFEKLHKEELSNYETRWYYQEKYEIIECGENGVGGEIILRLFVGLWWIMTVRIVIFAVKKWVSYKKARKKRQGE